MKFDRRSFLIGALAFAPRNADAAEPGLVPAAQREGALAIAETTPGENFQKFMAAFKAK